MTDQAVQTIELPEPSGAVVMRAVTDRIQDDNKGVLVWVTGKPNPLTPDMKIVRMYSSVPDSGADESAPQIDNRRELRVYSTSPSKIVRHTISPDHVRLVEEGLTLDVFLEEIYAEEGIEVEEEDPENPEAAGESDTQPPPAGDALS